MIARMTTIDRNADKTDKQEGRIITVRSKELRANGTGFNVMRVEAAWLRQLRVKVNKCGSTSKLQKESKSARWDENFVRERIILFDDEEVDSGFEVVDDMVEAESL